jgi:uncharacterized protein YdiU (UPF0061 family)
MISALKQHTYGHLPERLFARVRPTPVGSPRIVLLNRSLASELGFDADELAGPSGRDLLSGCNVPKGISSLSTAYAGHQFGHFVPLLGDGRAILLGEVVTRTGKSFDIQLKGSGPTPYSSRGDGRAWLGPVLREYIMSEAMAALNVPTTRGLAAVLTGERIQRQTLVPGAILARVAASHIRIGTFQFLSARRDIGGLQLLADYVISWHYPHCLSSGLPYLALLEAVVEAQAKLVAQWMTVGFIHGVLNTDNVSIVGETLDYGPCAFLDTYDPMAVFSSIDQFGRYSYINQSRVTKWNLERLAEAMLPLLSASAEEAARLAEKAVAAFEPTYEDHYISGMRRKLGLFDQEEMDAKLVVDLLALMYENSSDWTKTFRTLCGAVDDDADLREALGGDIGASAWISAWRARIAREPRAHQGRRAAMEEANPLIVPRDHLVNSVVRAAVDESDFTPLEELISLLRYPFQQRELPSIYTEPPGLHERVEQTFCGT